MKLQTAFLLLVAAVGSLQAGVFYSNITTDTGYTDTFISNGLVEAGDEILFGPATSVWATTVTTALYNSGSSGVGNVTLRVYSVDDLENLGPQIYFATLSGVSFSANSVVPLIFSNVNTVLPSRIVWTLSYASADSIAPELMSYDPPTIGSSDNSTVWWDSGSGLALTTTGFTTENYYMEVSGEAVPEPSPIVMVAGGFAILAFYKHRLWSRT